MKNSQKLILQRLIKLINSSEIKYKDGDYKNALKDKKETIFILDSNTCDAYIYEKFNEELCRLYTSKFDLINDHKKLIDEKKRNEIICLLEKRSKEKYLKGDFKGAIKALRRSDKYKIEV